MTKRKKAAAWRARFLRALARLGNVRAAAEAAGVDHTTAYGLRKRDAGFAAKWEEARAKAQEAPPPPCRRRLLRAGSGSRHAPGMPRRLHPPPRAGEELIARYSKRHGVQMVRVGPGRWSPKVEAVYLAHLRTTGCLRRAAAGVGFSTTAVDYRRKRYPAFAAQCDAALEESFVQLRSFVAAAGIASFDPFPEPLPEGVELPKVTVAEAISILRLKGASGAPGTGPTGRRHMPEEPSIEEVRQNILRKLDAIEAHERRQAGD